jgi:hypothetical protein
LSALAAVLTLVLLAAVVLVVTGPLRARVRAERERERLHGERADLEAAREAKYREIRDCELDYRTGKLSDEDFAAIDGQLRREALAILDRLERLEAQKT